MKWKRYPSYKDSGVKWLGEVPAHWRVTSMKRLGQFKSGNGFPHEFQGQKEEEIPFYKVSDTNLLGNEVFMKSHNNSVSTDVATDLRVNIFPEKSIIFPKVGATVFLNKRRILLRPAVIDNNMMGCEPLRCYYLWLYYWLCGLDLTQWVHPGAVPSVGEEVVSSINALIPPIDEQHTISSFLDRKTSHIDALIAKKERQIELLEEKRTALITQAVTKGLDPNVKMKDSGVEWLGEVPAHWELRPLKHTATFVNGAAFKPDDWREEGIPIIRIENLNGGTTFNYSSQKISEKYHVYEGDLLFGWSGNRGTSFGPFLWQRAGLHYLNQHIFKIVDYVVDKAWLYWMLRAATIFVEKQAHGIIGMVHITKGDLGAIPVPDIPCQEQKSIGLFVEQNAESINNSIRKIQQSIDKLQEYRSALISAAVTGQIDVREEV